MTDKKEEICHVCKKVKKSYIVFIDSNILSLMNHQTAREDGPICERCNQYYAMTGVFKDATSEEFEIAKQSAWFARMVLKWWEKDEKLAFDDNDMMLDNSNRQWEGTAMLSSWCREELSKEVKKDGPKSGTK